MMLEKRGKHKSHLSSFLNVNSYAKCSITCCVENCFYPLNYVAKMFLCGACFASSRKVENVFLGNDNGLFVCNLIVDYMLFPTNMIQISSTLK